MRRGLRQLAEARLLADDTSGGAHRPRHALLAEAVTAGLLPGERVVLHERTARLLDTVGGDALAAEAASHWAAAGRGAEELAARLVAAGAAERVFGYARRAPTGSGPSTCVRHCPVRSVPTCPGCMCGPSTQPCYPVTPGTPACWRKEAYGRFASHPDHATAAVICQRAGYLRGCTPPMPGAR